MNHKLWIDASSADHKIANDAADWLLDAIATSTQDRKYLRGDPEYDEVAGEAILLNGRIAALRAIKSKRD